MKFIKPTIESYREQTDYSSDNGKFWAERYRSTPCERDIPTWSVAFHCDEFDNGERWYHAYLEEWTDVPLYPGVDAPNWLHRDDIIANSPARVTALLETAAWLENRAHAFASIAAGLRVSIDSPPALLATLEVES